MKGKYFIIVAYVIAIVVLILFIVEHSDITKLYWTRLSVLALMGICAILSIGSYINTSVIKKIKATLVETIEVTLGAIYLILLIINIAI